MVPWMVSTKVLDKDTASSSARSLHNEYPLSLQLPDGRSQADAGG